MQPGTAAAILERTARGVQLVSPQPGWWDRAWAPTTTFASSARVVWPRPRVGTPEGLAGAQAASSR